MIGNNSVNNVSDNNQFNNLNNNVVTNIDVPLDDNEERKKEKKKIQATLTLILVLFLSVTSATYAYFAISATNNTTIAGTSATVNLTLNVTKIYPKAPNASGALVPQLTGNPLSNALKAGCVDANTNVVCQVYKITIQNVNGTATQVVDGKILFFGTSNLSEDLRAKEDDGDGDESNDKYKYMPDLRWRLLSSVDESTPAYNVLGSNADKLATSAEIENGIEIDNRFATNVTLAKGDIETYYVIVWLNETNVDQIEQSDKDFYGQVKFDSSNGTGVTSTFTP